MTKRDCPFIFDPDAYLEEQFNGLLHLWVTMGVMRNIYIREPFVDGLLIL